MGFWKRQRRDPASEGRPLQRGQARWLCRPTFCRTPGKILVLQELVSKERQRIPEDPWLQEQKQRHVSLGTEHVRGLSMVLLKITAAFITLFFKTPCHPAEMRKTHLLPALRSRSKSPILSRLLWLRCLWSLPPYDTRKTVLLTSRSAPA